MAGIKGVTGVKNGVLQYDWLVEQVTSNRERSRCWLWPWRTNKGYGRVWCNGQEREVHGLALIADGSPRPDGLYCLHSCDIKSCFNPDHLQWETQKQNVKEAIERGQKDSVSSGIASARARGQKVLNEAERAELCRLYGKRGGEHTWQSLAKNYGIGCRTVGAILKRGRSLK